MAPCTVWRDQVCCFLMIAAVSLPWRGSNIVALVLTARWLHDIALGEQEDVLDNG